MDAEADLPPREQVLRILGGKWLCAAVVAAAALGLPEALAAKPRTAEALARDLDCDAASLERLAAALVGAGILVQGDAGALALSEAGRMLRDDDLGPLARLIGTDFYWSPWSDLAEGVRSGRPAFEVRHGRGLFDHLDANAEAASDYHTGIEAFVREEGEAIAEAFDFSAAKRVVDLGGGQGDLLVRLLTRWPHLSGVLVERPFAAERGRARLAASGLSDRAEALAGDLLEAVPAGGDVYLLKHVLHCLDDHAAERLLSRCAARLSRAGTLLVIEGLRLPNRQLDQTGLLDLEMLMLFGTARERSKPEMRRLLSAAGLRLVRAPALPTGARLLVVELA